MDREIDIYLWETVPRVVGFPWRPRCQGIYENRRVNMIAGLNIHKTSFSYLSLILTVFNIKKYRNLLHFIFLGRVHMHIIHHGKI